MILRLKTPVKICLVALLIAGCKPVSNADGTSRPASIAYYTQTPDIGSGLSCLAMALNAFGANVTAQSLFTSAGSQAVYSTEKLAALARTFSLDASSTSFGSIDIIKKHIDSGHLVIMQGDFSQSGHFILITGYDSTGWIVNDPAGEWDGMRSGKFVPDHGEHVHYLYANVAAVATLPADATWPDSYWLTVIARK